MMRKIETMLAVLVAALPGTATFAGQEPPEGGVLTAPDEEYLASDGTWPTATPLERDYTHGPRIVKQTKPRYPEKAFRQRQEGVVDVEFVIDANGHVGAMRVIGRKGKPRPSSLLQEAAMKTVREWEFKPAVKDGTAVATVARAPVSFRIFSDK